ncbi:MAG: cytochrome P450 [Acidimicrobiia bacterium]|nr:cytochrome P450 [Acidimicrobiia bacterium]
MSDAEGTQEMAGFGQFSIDQETAANPQQFYPMMREMGILPMEDMTIITRHEDVMWALRHPEVFSSNMDAIDIGNVRPLIPLQIDPPDHVKFRRLLDPLFAPREIEKLEGAVRALVTELIDTFIDQGTCEFNSAVAIPLPCTVFLRLMGLPLEDLDLFLRFKDGIIRPPAADLAEGRALARATGQEIYAYFEQVISERRERPQDDLITGFIGAEIDGERLTTEDILDISYLFLLAGLDTVTASLGCAVAYLAAHPDRQAALRSDPSLIPAAVEELLRWETPVPGILRVATEAVELAGATIPAGRSVTCLLASANTDGAEFADPETVDFERSGNRHLAFGAGVHRCLGSHLARVEMRVALEELHRRVPQYEVQPGETPIFTAGIRGVEYLPLVWETA